MSAAFTFRDAVPGDEEIVAGFVRALAEYEKLAHEAKGTPEDFRRALFGSPARCHALIVEAAGGPVGFALWFHNFSTFTGSPGLYVEDVYVQPEWRKNGIGRAIFRELARRALAEGCARMEWSVLDWNEPAIRFYRSLGASPKSDWTIQQLSGATLEAVAA